MTSLVMVTVADPETDGSLWLVAEIVTVAGSGRSPGAV
jgi:hypothetical protein